MCRQAKFYKEPERIKRNGLIFALKSIFTELWPILGKKKKKKKNPSKSAFSNFLFQNSLKSL